LVEIQDLYYKGIMLCLFRFCYASHSCELVYSAITLLLIELYLKMQKVFWFSDLQNWKVLGLKFVL